MSSKAAAKKKEIEEKVADQRERESLARKLAHNGLWSCWEAVATAAVCSPSSDCIVCVSCAVCPQKSL